MGRVDKKATLMKLNEVVAKAMFLQCKREIFDNEKHPKFYAAKSDSIEFKHSSGTVWAVKDGEPVAFCLWFLVQDCGLDGIGSINNLYVKPEFRGQNLGFKLISLVYLYLIEKFPMSGLLSEQCGESESGRKVLLKFNPITLDTTNCMGEPLLLITEKQFVLQNIQVKPSKSINHYLRKIHKDLKYKDYLKHKDLKEETF